MLVRIGMRKFGGLSIAILISCSIAFAQRKLPESRITLDVSGLPLSVALEMISSKSGIPFSYNPKKIPSDQNINYKADDKLLQAVLDDLAALVGLNYSFIENQIILKAEKKSDRASSHLTLSGYVKDASSGEALIGATIFLKEAQAGVVSNAYGFYSITVPRGVYGLACSFIGYGKLDRTIDLQTSASEDIVMAEAPPVLKEIIVSASPTDLVLETQTSKSDLRPHTVEQRPALFGEMDVIKSLESIPGIKLHSDGSTFYSVRGGSRDQNLVLIDDAPIYNPSHMLGIFSTIIPDVVNDITIYKGEMPASLGGRLSSVLDVRTKKGNDQHVQAWGSAGLISTKLGVEGPFKKDVSSYLLSGRFSRLKWFFTLADNDIRQFQFHDLTGKMNFKLNNRNKIFFSFYSGSDNYFISNSGIEWANKAATFRWNHLLSDKLFLNTTFSASGYDYFLHADVARNTRWNSHISNFNLKADFSYFIKPKNAFTFGIGLGGYYFNPGNLNTNDPNLSLPVLSVRNSAEVVLYGNHEVELNSHWALNYGLRLTSWRNTGEAFEFRYDGNKNPIDTLTFQKGEEYARFANLEPRLSISYVINKSSSIKTGFARNVQNVHLISNSISPFTSLDVWLPTSLNIRPQASNQVSIGYYQTLDRPGILLVVESFYKKMENQIDCASHAETLLNPFLEGQLQFGRATSYGTEIQIKKEEGRLRGWAGYSYSRARRKFQAIDEGRPYNAFYDRPHQVNFVLAYDLSLRWNLGLNWNYYTGAPFSSPVSFFNQNGHEVPIYGNKNNDRLPNYHRMDLSATFKINKNPERKFQHSLTFSIYNLYGRKNALFVNYNKTLLEDGTFKIPANLMEHNQVTSQLYLFRLVPSFSYNFKWR